MFAASGAMGNLVVVLFTIGIVAASFSSADSALTAITTSLCVDILGTYLDGNVCQRMLDGAEDYIRRHGVPKKRKLNLWRKYTSIKTFGRIKKG